MAYGVLGDLPDQNRFSICIGDTIPADLYYRTIELNRRNCDVGNGVTTNGRCDLWCRGWGGNGTSRLWARCRELVNRGRHLDDFGRWGEEFIYLDYCGLESKVDGCYYCHYDDWRNDNPGDLLYTSSL